MGRAPCCEKMGLKKGPWTHDEDQILVSYIQKHGHGNWRALPKQAGLLRCGKSCRLRWTNYLRPDIKRGNFTKEEEDTIINLHEMLGNRWSMIAAKLPGRTDNEIKNVWHTHLKKRLPSYQNTNQGTKRHATTKWSMIAAKLPGRTDNEIKNVWHTHLKKRLPSYQNTNQGTKRHATTKSESGSNDHLSSQLKQEPTVSQNLFEPEASCAVEQPVSPQHSSSELSTVTETTTDSSVLVKHEQMDYNSSETFLDDSFWSEALSGEESSMVESNLSDGLGLEFPMPSYAMMENIDKRNPDGDDDSVDFWYNIFTRAEELPELPEF